MRILIAEKDPSGRRLMEQMMRMEGYEVFVAKHVKEAKRLIGELAPDIVLMNVFSPLQAGKEPLEQVRICCKEETGASLYVTCIGQCNELNADDACETSVSLFDRLPTSMKMDINVRIQSLCIALKQLKRWLATQNGFSLEKNFSMGELESFALTNVMGCRDRQMA